MKGISERMTLEEMKQHEWDVPWSGGKDSTATILLMLEHGIPIRQVKHVRMMWDETLPATLPEMTEFVDSAVERLRGMGLKVNVVPSIKTASELAKKKFKKSKVEEQNGKEYQVEAFMRGFCTFSGVKAETSKATADKDSFCMLGYAADETNRLHRLNDKTQSILAVLGIKEEKCLDICRKQGLLSPVYDMRGISRDGCWFCPNANKRERERVREEHPELYARIVDMIESCEFGLSGMVYRNNWLMDYAKEHPDDWRWKDSKRLKPKGYIDGQEAMKEEMTDD